MYQFFLLMREDIAREEKDQILYDKIFDDIWKNADQHRMFYESDDVMLNKYLPNLLNILTDNKTNVNAAIALIRQNQTLSGKLALHLAKEMGELRSVNTALDLAMLQRRSTAARRSSGCRHCGRGQRAAAEESADLRYIRHLRQHGHG